MIHSLSVRLSLYLSLCLRTCITRAAVFQWRRMPARLVSHRHLMIGLSLWLGILSAAQADDAVKTSAEKPGTKATEKWTPLFNGKDLTGWKSTNFGGEGEVYVEDGVVVISQGVDLSGVTSTRKDLPKKNYEVEFEARRMEGSDFFAGLTFPFHDSACSVILGGWGGGVTGLSSIDGLDASENETTGYVSFTKGQWYHIRVRVTDHRIQAWLDKKSLADVDTTDKKIDVRFEVEPSKPLGFSTYQTTAQIRNARLRTLSADEVSDKDGQ